MTSHTASFVQQQAPLEIRELYKELQKLKASPQLQDARIVDLHRKDVAEEYCCKVALRGYVAHDRIEAAYSCIGDRDTLEAESSEIANIPIYECLDIPGLLVMPSLLSTKMQWLLVDHLLHQALANPLHMTNVHFHHQVPYDEVASTGNSSIRRGSGSQDERSFFDIGPHSQCAFVPKNPAVHKPFSISQFLQKKLRWITVGAQYDWTEKVYPERNDPPFPPRIASFVRELFPQTKAEAAIVNLYSPGDTLNVHRDVSEHSPNGLVSLSIGCEGLFVIGLGTALGESCKPLCLRLRSGDAVYMDGRARHAWHGVPKVFSGTCPKALRDWPAVSSASGEKYAEWRGWMVSKRINFNVRQL